MNSSIITILIVLAVFFVILLVQKAIKMAFLLLLLFLLLGYLAYEHVPEVHDEVQKQKTKIQEILNTPEEALKP